MNRALVAGLVVVAAACGGRGGSGAKADTTARDTLTERQHDSVLARSSVPGAGAVGAAMRAADSASARVRGDTASP